MPEHIVRQGDCISSIAQKYGYFWEKVWNHPKNAELKKLRTDPNILYPGDVVFIPEKEEKHETGSTGQKHRFRKKGVPERLNLVLLLEGEPRANEDYILDIEGDRSKGKTDAEGRVSIAIPPGARRGKLTFIEGGEEFDLDLGGLDPINEISGVQDRLANLGYSVKVTGKWGEESSEALRQFQRKHNLEATGDIDETTKQKLQEVYGS